MATFCNDPKVHLNHTVVCHVHRDSSLFQFCEIYTTILFFITKYFGAKDIENLGVHVPRSPLKLGPCGLALIKTLCLLQCFSTCEKTLLCCCKHILNILSLFNH